MSSWLCCNPPFRQRTVLKADGCACMQEGSRKQPFYVNMGEGQTMRMAGLFDVWSGGADDAPLYTYTVMTTDSSKRLQWRVYMLIAHIHVSSFLTDPSSCRETEAHSSRCTSHSLHHHRALCCQKQSCVEGDFGCAGCMTGCQSFSHLMNRLRLGWTPSHFLTSRSSKSVFWHCLRMTLV